MRVFVSSTCYDLLDLRAEVEAHLQEMGLTPLLSDRPSSDFEVLPEVNCDRDLPCQRPRFGRVHMHPFAALWKQPQGLRLPGRLCHAPRMA